MILHILFRSGRLLLAVIIAALPLIIATPVRGSEDPKEKQRAGTAGKWPPGTEASFGSLKETEDGGVLLEGAVTIIYKEIRFQADRIVLHDKRYIEAEGNILVVWGRNRIAGTRMRYDLEEDRGVIEDAIGSLDPEYQFEAREVEKVGDDLVYLTSARVTTCTQPVPYWSFRVSKARVRIDGYARMWNVRLKTRRLPIFYIPFLLWPVKEGRAPGIMLPEIHTTQNRGDAITLPIFLPLGRSADLTLTGTNFSIAGFGGGAEFRYIPNENGRLGFSGFYINDKVDDAARYRATYQQTQKFRNGFRMVADVNVLSDFDYFNDFERELRLTSSPSILARVEFSRNDKKGSSLNIRELRREQLFTGGDTLVQETLPEIELRGRSRRIGKTPFYLSYVSSLARIVQRQEVDRPLGPGEVLLDADYLRADLYPTISAPLSTVPWLDITPKLSYRLTYYTQSQEEFETGTGGTQERVLDDSLSRGLGTLGVEIVGPKFYRIFDRPNSKFSKKYKHTVETTFSYGYGQEWDRQDDIIVYDEVDRYRGGGNDISYGLRSRLLAKRPRSGSASYRGSGESIVMPGGVSSDPPLDGELPAAEPGEGSGDEEEVVLEPVEIATLQISQQQSLENDISFADLDGDGTREASGRRSDIQLIGRLNPTPRFSMDLRSSYDPLYKEIEGVTLAGSLMGDRGRLRFSLVHRNGLGGRIVGYETGPDGNQIPIAEPNVNDTQLQMDAGLNLFGRRLRIDVVGSYDANPGTGQKRFGEKQWRLQYSTQCCTFLLERLARGFSDDNQRQDFYFRVDLRGVGKILDQHF